jgi:hypothetical protein
MSYIQRLLDKKKGTPIPGTGKTGESLVAKSGDSPDQVPAKPAKSGSAGFAGIQQGKSDDFLRGVPGAPMQSWPPRPAELARWPDAWRERWGRRANELQDCGEPWDAAEWIAYGELAPDLADAEHRGEVVCADAPAGLSGPEAVAAIDRAFADPTPVRRSDRGPRDARHGDRWLPWHFRRETS